MQNAGFGALGIDAHFQRFDVPPESLADFIEHTGRKTLSGFAVSLPHKESIITLLDGIGETAERIGAVNTVVRRDGRLWGDNTDADGFWESVAEFLPEAEERRAAVIGAGGAARAIVYILRRQGIRVTVFNRTREKAEAIAAAFSANVDDMEHFRARDFDLVVNSTSVGLKEEKSPVPAESWNGFTGVAFDAVFMPLRTLFLRQAEAAGATIVTGDRMPLFQGLRQFEAWTGKDAPKAAMEAALHKSIRPLETEKVF